MKNKNYQITDDHIGIFNNYFPNDLCKRYVNFFDEMEKNNLTLERPAPETIKKDNAFDLVGNLKNKNVLKSFNVNYNVSDVTNVFFNEIYPEYTKRFSILNDYERHTIQDVKLQKTNPKEGYHVWHCESGSAKSNNRIAVFILYLNSIKDGGETEFLYQSKRIKPVENKLILFPCSYTHVHRGNPPLKESKYILTGWVEFGH